ncbi:MAG: biotin/lipoyl-binding protein [Bacteroidetes bacterium]|nr:MAG: biotin/lipoyl-binding protein [Bacteroidota bacterium]
MSKTVLALGEKHITVEERNGVLVVDGRQHSADIVRLTEGEYSVLLDGQSYHVLITATPRGLTATVRNHTVPLRRHTLREQLTERYASKGTGEHSDLTVNAPMPGLITRILRHEGSMVTSGEGVLVIEAMKMENELRAARSGTVKRIFVKEKQTVEKGDPLFSIE